MSPLHRLIHELQSKSAILNGHEPSFSSELKLIASALSMGDLGGAHESLVRLADAAHLLDRRNLCDWLQEQLIALEAVQAGTPEPAVDTPPLLSEIPPDRRCSTSRG